MRTDGENRYSNGRRYAIETVIVLAVVVITVLLAGAVLWQRGNISDQGFNAGFDFGIPIMLLAGEGFASPDASASPELAAFLAGERTSLDLDELPEHLPARPLDHYLEELQAIRAYNLYVVAAVWWLFGIHWDNLYIVVHLLHAGATAALYAFLRLTLPRLWAAVVTLFCMSPPLAMPHIIDIRDYSKVPFILGILFLLGWCIRRPLRLRQYLVLSAFAGLLTAIGLGFRQDVIVVIPPSLLVLGVFVRGTPRLGAAHRAAGVLLYAGVVFLGAQPVPWLHYERGSEYPHNVLMGMTSPNERAMDLSIPSYERLTVRTDMYVSLAPHFHYKRTTEAPEQGTRHIEDTPAEKSLVLEIAAAFPADALTRGFAAIIAFARGTAMKLEQPVVVQWIALASLIGLVLVSASRSMMLGFGVLFLVLYFGAYHCLQFSMRHYAHYIFVPFWLQVLGVYRVAGPAWRLFRRRKKPDAAGAAQAPETAVGAPVRRRVQRAGIFVLIVLLIALPVYAVLLAVQHDQVVHRLQAREKAEYEPVPVTREQGEQVTLMRLKRPLPGKSEPNFTDGWKANYLVAQFEGVRAPFAIWLHFVAPSALYDFSHPAYVNFANNNNEGVDIQYFFPVYESYKADFHGHGWNCSRFEGVVIRNELVPHFKGLRRVVEPEQFPLWTHFTLPSPPGKPITWQRVGGPGQQKAEFRFYNSPANPFWRCYSIWDAPNQPERRLEIFDELLVQWPQVPSFWFHKGEALRELGAAKKAHHAFRRTIAVDPSFDLAYWRLLAQWLESDDAASGLEMLAELRRKHPDLHTPYFFTGRLLEEQGRRRAAMAYYRAALERFPWHHLSQRRLRQLEPPEW
ncbi:MAG: hypothetical protein ACLFTT_10680 [Candidatus Hydrogenedentota bacterium]